MYRSMCRNGLGRYILTYTVAMLTKVISNKSRQVAGKYNLYQKSKNRSRKHFFHCIVL